MGELSDRLVGAEKCLTDRQRLNDEYMRGYNAASAMCDGLLAIERAAQAGPPPLDVEPNRCRVCDHECVYCDGPVRLSRGEPER